MPNTHAAQDSVGQIRRSFVYVWGISIAAAMGGLLFGYDWVVIGGAKAFYEKYFNLVTPAQVGWAMSSALIGCLVGALVSGLLSDRYGRKRLLVASALLFAVSSIGTGMAGTFAAFVAWRILGGAAIGLASNLSPMYIAEVAPSAIRGRLVSINQLAIVIGILLAQCVNWFIARPVPAGATASQILESWNGQFGWRWMFGVTAIPAVLFFAVMLLVPESPRWLVNAGQIRRARAILERIGGAGFAEQELRTIEATPRVASTGGAFRALLAPQVVSILGLGIFLAVLQQWCGINVVFNYAQEIFSAAGYQVSDILFDIVVTGATNVAFTFVAIFLVDRVGRRVLMLVGCVGLSIAYMLIGLSYQWGLRGWPVLTLVVVAVALYALSLAPVTWVVLSEIFPNSVRGAAMGVGIFALWSACFVLTYTFPALNATLGSSGVFYLYGGICVIGWLVIYRKLPETKNKSLEQIEREFAANR